MGRGLLPERLKDEGKRRVTLTGNKELAKNFEFANDDYTTRWSSS